MAPCPCTATKPSCCARTSWQRPTASSRCSPAQHGIVRAVAKGVRRTSSALRLPARAVHPRRPAARRGPQPRRDHPGRDAGAVRQHDLRRLRPLHRRERDARDRRAAGLRGAAALGAAVPPARRRAAGDDRGRAPRRRRARLLPAALAGGGRLRAVVRRPAPTAVSRGRTARSARPPAGRCAPAAGCPGSASPATETLALLGALLAGDWAWSTRPSSATVARRAVSSRRTSPGTSSAACDPCPTSAKGERCAGPARQAVARRPVRRPDPHPSGATPPDVPARPGAGARRDHHGRQRPLGQRARPAAHGRPRAGRALAVRRGRGRHRDRREGHLRLRVLHRELVALPRRGEVPDGLQPRRDPAPSRRDARARRTRALGRPRAAAVALGDQGAPGRRGADPRQRRADADDVRQLRRPRRARRRRPGDRPGRRRRPAEPRRASTSAPSPSTSTSPSSPTPTWSGARRGSSG